MSDAGPVRGGLYPYLDPLPGRWALCWRINYASAERFDLARGHGRVTEATLGKLISGVRSAIEPLA